MNILGYILVGIFALVGGVSSLYCFLSIPAILVWKIYRKIKFKYSIYD